MDSISETMGRIYALLDRHCPRLMEGASLPEVPLAPAPRDLSYRTHEPYTRKIAESLLKSGNSPLVVAEMTGVPKNTVNKWSLELGLSWPLGRRYRAARRDMDLYDQSVALLKAGKLPHEVAVEKSVSINTVRKWARELGLRFGSGRRKKEASN